LHRNVTVMGKLYRFGTVRRSELESVAETDAAERSKKRRARTSAHAILGSRLSRASWRCSPSHLGVESQLMSIFGTSTTLPSRHCLYRKADDRHRCASSSPPHRRRGRASGRRCVRSCPLLPQKAPLLLVATNSTLELADHNPRVLEVLTARSRTSGGFTRRSRLELAWRHPIRSTRRDRGAATHHAIEGSRINGGRLVAEIQSGGVIRFDFRRVCSIRRKRRFERRRLRDRGLTGMANPIGL